MICFIRGRNELIKVEKQCSLLNYAFVKKTKTSTKMKILDKKKHDFLDF